MSEDKDLWREEAGGRAVYVRRYRPAHIFGDADKPFSAWLNGGGIGHHRTLKGAITFAHRYLTDVLLRDLDEATSRADMLNAELKRLGKIKP